MAPIEHAPESDAGAPPLFSVIVPTYGRPQYVSEAIASILGQTVDDFECLVVDDASPEPVRVPDDPRVKVIRRHSNGGPAAARNTGMDEARGRYIAFLDDDDLFTPDRLALAVEGLRRSPVAVCLGGVVGDATGAASGRVLEGDVSDTIRNGICPHLGQTAVRREALLRLDERLVASHDVDWWIRLAQAQTVTTVPRVGYLHRYHPGDRHRNAAPVRVRCLQMILELHAPYFASHRTARAFHLKRLGLTALRAGERRTAVRAFARSLVVRPRVRTAWHLVRALAPMR